MTLPLQRRWQIAHFHPCPAIRLQSATLVRATHERRVLPNRTEDNQGLLGDWRSRMPMDARSSSQAHHGAAPGLRPEVRGQTAEHRVPNCLRSSPTPGLPGTTTARSWSAC
jgi:hypothetical protein